MTTDPAPHDAPPERAQQSAPAPGRTLLVLGACGDLTARLLLPGLGGLLRQGAQRDLLLLGCDRDEHDDAWWRSRVSGALGAADPSVDAVARSARYVRADVVDPGDLRRVLDACRGQVVVYFALPPAVTVQACRALVETGVPAGTRLVMEKPFGTDAADAEALNALVGRLVPEDQVFRVDHYLGMSTVLNILGLRFTNRMLESVLDAEHVERVEIVFDETLGLEGRAGYYDTSGALVDMVQSHSLQVLALLAMEPPSTVDARDLRDAKAQVLRATTVWADDPVGSSRRARYTAGTVDGRQLPSYMDEPGVDADRRTETFAEVVVAVNTWRWAGVPFVLRAGKAMRAQRKEVVLSLRPPPWVPTGLSGERRRERVRIGFDPDRLRLEFNLNGPGDPFDVEPMAMEAGFAPGDLPPYGQVLAGVLDGDPTLSVRADSAVQTWRIVEPVLAAWRDDRVPLQEYAAGSDGPDDVSRRTP